MPARYLLAKQRARDAAEELHTDVAERHHRRDDEPMLP